MDSYVKINPAQCDFCASCSKVKRLPNDKIPAGFKHYTFCVDSDKQCPKQYKDYIRHKVDDSDESKIPYSVKHGILYIKRGRKTIQVIECDTNGNSSSSSSGDSDINDTALDDYDDHCVIDCDNDDDNASVVDVYCSTTSMPPPSLLPQPSPPLPTPPPPPEEKQKQQLQTQKNEKQPKKKRERKQSDPKKYTAKRKQQQNKQRQADKKKLQQQRKNLKRSYDNFVDLLITTVSNFARHNSNVITELCNYKSKPTTSK